MNESHLLKNDVETCARPLFCDIGYFNRCLNITLRNCEVCQTWKADFYLFALFMISLVCIFGNLLVFLLIVFCDKKSRTKNDYIKASLSIADILCGIYLLGISIPSLFWTLSSTPEEVVKSAIESRGSLEAVLGGTFLLFSYGISIYHLMYMSAQRFCAVKWPFLYRAQSDRAVFCHIAMLWVFGILCSTVPAWFPEDFQYQYRYDVYRYIPTYVTANEQNKHVGFHPEIFCAVVFVLLPFIIMVVLTSGTCYLSSVTMRNSRRLRNENISRKRAIKFEIKLFKKFAFLQIAFHLAVLPVAILIILIYRGLLVCEESRIWFIVFFNVASANGFLNVNIYSFGDKKFRRQLCNMVKRFFKNISKTTEDSSRRISVQTVDAANLNNHPELNATVPSMV